LTVFARVWYFSMARLDEPEMMTFGGGFFWFTTTIAQHLRVKSLVHASIAEGGFRILDGVIGGSINALGPGGTKRIVTPVD
jgi:hypothetical protein